MVGCAVLKQLKNLNCCILSAPHHKFDLTSQSQTQDWLNLCKPDIVIMAAAKVGGIGANMAEPAKFMYENLAMTQNIIHGSYLAGVKKLIYLGSSCIYPKMAAQPIREESLLTAALEPSNEAYALAKIAGVKLCQYYSAQYGCDFISAMPTNLYGEHDHYNTEKSHVIPSMILKFHQAKLDGNKQAVLWGTGQPLREFLYVDDLAKALIHLLENYNDSNSINIGSGEELSISQLAFIIKEIVGFKGNIVFDKTKPDGTPRKLLDSRKISSLGWKAETPLHQGLQNTYEDFLTKFSALSAA